MKAIQIKENQSVLDIAIEHYGAIEKAFDVVKDNKLKGLLDNLGEGETLLIQEENNKQMVDFLSPYRIQSLTKGARGSGIGFWAIGKDFQIMGE